jgi:hypothetical protein
VAVEQIGGARGEFGFEFGRRQAEPLAEQFLHFLPARHVGQRMPHGLGFGLGSGDGHHPDQDVFVDLHGHFHLAVIGMASVPYRKRKTVFRQESGLSPDRIGVRDAGSVDPKTADSTVNGRQWT